MGIGQATEGKGGNCGFTLLPTKLHVDAELPDFCSCSVGGLTASTCPTSSREQFTEGQEAGGSFISLHQTFLNVRGQGVLGNSPFRFRHRCVPEGVSFRSPPVGLCLLLHFLCLFIFIMLSLSLIINYSLLSCLVLSLFLLHLFCLFLFLSLSA